MNSYRGSRIALWILGVILLMKILMSVNCIFNGYDVATKADGIPLATFPPEAVQMVVYDFAAWGIAQLAIAVIGVIVLVRYRTLVPMMFAVLLAEMLTRKLAAQFLPVPRNGTPPGVWVNLTLIALMGIGLVLSLWRSRRQLQAAEVTP